MKDKTPNNLGILNMDAKDILGLPKTPLPLPQEKKSRPQKDSQRKPDGISREVLRYFALSFHSIVSNFLDWGCFRTSSLRAYWWFGSSYAFH